MGPRASVEAPTTVNKHKVDHEETNKAPDDATDYSEKSLQKAKFSDFTRVFAYTSLTDRILLGFAVLGQVGTGATLPLMNIVFGNLASDFAEYFIPGSGVTRAQFDKALNRQTLYIVYLFAARWVLGYYSLFVLRVIGLRISAKLRLEYLKALFRLPISVLDTLPSGQASNTITTTANTLQMGISDKLGQLIQSQSMLFAAIIISFKFSWALSLVTSSVLLFMGIAYGYVVPNVLRLTKDVMFADEKAASIAGEVLGSIRMIVACGAQDRIAKRYNGWVEESRRRGLLISPFMGANFAPIYFSIYASMALCFWFGFKLYRENHIDSVGTIVIVLMSMMIVATSSGQAASPIIAITKATGAACDFFAIIDAPKPSVDGLKHPEASAQEDIRFESVDFAYPSRPHVKVLDRLSLKFDSGKITAIVGASGSGKSTIVGLLERWYALENETIVIPKAISGPKDPDKKDPVEVTTEPITPITLGGSIKVGAHELSDLDLKWWRSQIGLVQQEPFIFNDTIAKNVAYGLVGSVWENEDEATKKVLVEQACKEAFADEFISKLPLGYETQVGDAGIKLSGGQRQRLAIARSIVKRPKVLVLDEATSAIDVRGEKLVQAALDRVSEGRTTITIAHRLSTIKKADKIVVMKKGQVVEEGTHDSLLENENGVYFALVNAQQLSMDETFFQNADAIHEAHMETVQQEMSTADREEDTPELDRKPRSPFRSFGTLIDEQKHHWFWYSALLFATISTAVATPIQAYLFAQLMHVISLTGDALKASANHWSLMFFILALGVAAGYFILGMSSNTISTHITCHYRQEYFESILAKPIKFFDADENSSGSLTARVSSDPTQLQQLLGMNMALAMNAVFSLLGCIIIAFIFGWKLSLVAVFVALPIIITGSFIRIRYEIVFEKMNQAVFEESSKFAAESINAFRTVTALTLEDIICRRYEVLLADHVNKAFKKARYACLVFAGSDSFPLLCMALTFWYGGRLLGNFEYGPVEFFVVYIAIIVGSESAGQLLSLGPNMAQAAAAAQRILSFRVRDNGNNKAGLELQEVTGGVEIELKDVWFKYPTRDVPIFTGLSIKIERGQFAALVGASGCGKTSIVSLVERFYDIQKGKILCNGTNIADMDLDKYRKSISLVAQEPTMFQGTIKQNVLLGVSESTPDELLHQACRDAEIHEFIMSLPDGYNTDVGSKGVMLSGGQKQRLSVARALIRNPKILLLDEATSSLDSESEKLVQAAFERAASGRTMLVVAHRLATVQNADVIFVLGEGKVLETGNHEELLRQRGVYYSMCQSQALDR